VLNGDLVATDGGGRVWIAGIVAPPPDSACGPAATDALRRLLADDGRAGWVWLEQGSDRSEGDGVAAAYLWVADGEEWYLLDEWLAFLGYAHAWDGGPYVERISTAEWDAYQNARGCLWQ
jgi:hypothetical protein